MRGKCNSTTVRGQGRAGPAENEKVYRAIQAAEDSRLLSLAFFPMYA
jgi:hypothetical protein